MTAQAGLPPGRGLSLAPPSARHPQAWTAGMPWHSSAELGLLPSAVADARRHARRTLRKWPVPADDAQTAELLVSELITNGLQGAWACGSGQPVSLALAASESVLTIEAWDGSPCPPVPSDLEDDVPPLDGGERPGAVPDRRARLGLGLVPDNDPGRKGDLVRTPDSLRPLTRRAVTRTAREHHWR